MVIPGYWKYETSGVLAPVVEAYLRGEELDPRGVATMRAYLRQWIAGDFREVEGLRDAIPSLTNTAQIRQWLETAAELDLDPF